MNSVVAFSDRTKNEKAGITFCSFLWNAGLWFTWVLQLRLLSEHQLTFTTLPFSCLCKVLPFQHFQDSKHLSLTNSSFLQLMAFLWTSNVKKHNRKKKKSWLLVKKSTGRLVIWSTSSHPAVHCFLSFPFYFILYSKERSRNWSSWKKNFPDCVTCCLISHGQMKDQSLSLL